jgi:predicted DNA-binding transcriptional regulator YafY
MVITIRYTNYRGETALRRILPKAIQFVSTQWHPEPQWVMEAFDLDRKEDRSFAIKDILDWKPVTGNNGN